MHRILQHSTPRARSPRHSELTSCNLPLRRQRRIEVQNREMPMRSSRTITIILQRPRGKHLPNYKNTLGMLHIKCARHDVGLTINGRLVLQPIHFHVFDFAYVETVCPEEIIVVTICFGFLDVFRGTGVYARPHPALSPGERAEHSQELGNFWIPLQSPIRVSLALRHRQLEHAWLKTRRMILRFPGAARGLW